MTHPLFPYVVVYTQKLKPGTFKITALVKRDYGHSWQPFDVGVMHGYAVDASRAAHEMGDRAKAVLDAARVEYEHGAPPSENPVPRNRFGSTLKTQGMTAGVAWDIYLNHASHRYIVRFPKHHAEDAGWPTMDQAMRYADVTARTIARAHGALENPLSTHTKLAIGVGATVAIVGAIAYFASRKASASDQKQLPQGGATPVAQGKWVPVTTFKQGKRYRVSANVRPLLQAEGLTLYTDRDQVPSDWPHDDLEPSRFRVEGVWPGSDTPVPTNKVPPEAGLKVYELQS